jgi:hypothetical protein
MNPIISNTCTNQEKFTLDDSENINSSFLTPTREAAGLIHRSGPNAGLFASSVSAEVRSVGKSDPWNIPMGHRVAGAYAEWFKKWDPVWAWYCSFTFRLGATKSGSIHPEKADKLFKRFLHDLNCKAFGKKYRNKPLKGVVVARATERGDKGGLLHYHALLGHIPVDISRMEWKEVWNGLAGFARIFPYDPSLGGVHYMAKSAYAFKRGEIDFIGPWERISDIMQESYMVPAIFSCGEAQSVQ